MTDRLAYLAQSADDIATYGPSMPAAAMLDALDGIVDHFTVPLTAERDRARDVAVELEGLVAAALDLHAKVDVGVGTAHHIYLCQHCGKAWPCTTATALGADVLIDDELVDLSEEVSA